MLVTKSIRVLGGVARFVGVVALLLHLFPVSNAAATTRYRIDPERSSIEFKVRHLASTVSGSFSKFEGFVEIDPDNVERCRVAAMINVSSLVTDDGRRTARLARDDFFSTAKFPTMRFQSDSWRKLNERDHEVSGRLTIKGVTHKILLQVREHLSGNDGQTRRWDATATLDRKDFGVNGGPPGLIGDEITITLKIEAAAVVHPSSQTARTTMISSDEIGERLILHGGVFESDGKTPVPNATLRIYHTDADGLYSREANNADGERNPRLQVSFRTDAQGRYEVLTIMPGRYPGGKSPAHIHMIISAPGYRERNATFSLSGDPALTPEDYERHGRNGTFSSIRPVEIGRDGVRRCQRDIKLEK
jgi:polyisoprenoid-binding protein YceI